MQFVIRTVWQFHQQTTLGTQRHPVQVVTDLICSESRELLKLGKPNGNAPG